MLNFISGKIIESSEGWVTVFTGSYPHSGVGYGLHVPKSSAYSEILKGTQVEFLVYTHVRQDVFDLYGFFTAAEKEMFLTLLNVNGVCPKAALGILSQIDVDRFVQIILTKNVEELVQIPGIGKKTAERLILELADPIRKKSESSAFISKASDASVVNQNLNMLEDAKNALMSLGYREQEVMPVLKKLSKEKNQPKVEEMIRTALQQLA